MACYNPLFRFSLETLGYSAEVARFAYGDAPFSILSQKLRDNDNFVCGFEFYDEVLKAVENNKAVSGAWRRDKLLPGFQKIPCGNCVGCRLDYSRQWANRCFCEASMHKDNWFLTLTYDDEHLLYGIDMNPKTGELVSMPRLVPEDLQKFLKRLRIAMQRDYGVTGIRFYACGEYGEHTFRPHYHVLLFGCPIPDLEFLKMGNCGSYFISDFISKLWKKGNILLANCDWSNCAYTARYVMKKQKGKSRKEHNEIRDIISNSCLSPVPEEFVRMSRRPGIGFDFWEKNFDKLLESDKIVIARGKKVFSSNLPRYFNSKSEERAPDRYAEKKKERENRANSARSAVFLQTELNDREYSLLEEDLQIEKIKAQKRNKL